MQLVAQVSMSRPKMLQDRQGLRGAAVVRPGAMTILKPFGVWVMVWVGLFVQTWRFSFQVAVQQGERTTRREVLFSLSGMVWVIYQFQTVATVRGVYPWPSLRMPTTIVVPSTVSLVLMS